MAVVRINYHDALTTKIAIFLYSAALRAKNGKVIFKILYPFKVLYRPYFTFIYLQVPTISIIIEPIPHDKVIGNL